MTSTRPWSSVKEDISLFDHTMRGYFAHPKTNLPLQTFNFHVPKYNHLYKQKILNLKNKKLKWHCIPPQFKVSTSSFFLFDFPIIQKSVKNLFAWNLSIGAVLFGRVRFPGPPPAFFLRFWSFPKSIYFFIYFIHKYHLLAGKFINSNSECLWAPEFSNKLPFWNRYIFS